jgi:anti-sigma factor RsiW
VIVVPLHDLEASVQIFPRATGTIAVFNWDEAGETGPAQATSVGTHHLLYWKHRGVEFWVVGDDADDVARFVGELRAQVG